MSKIELEAVASKLGMSVLKEQEEALEARIADACGDDCLSANAILERRSDAQRFVVAEVSIQRESANGPSREIRRTIVFFEAPEHEFPTFTVSPKSFTSPILSLLSPLTGVSRIEFPEDLEFSEGREVRTFMPDSTRAVLSPKARRTLVENPKLTVQADRSRLVVYEGDGRLKVDELPDFIRRAHTAIKALRRAVQETQEARPTREEAEKRVLESTGGLSGAMMRRAFVDGKIVDAFLGQSVPRRIPPEIRRQYLGIDGPILYGMGTIFTVAGIGMLAALWSETDSWLIALPFIGPVAGSIIIAVTFFVRRGKSQLLRHGECAHATFEKVDRTNVYVNGQQRYRVKLLFEVDGRERGTTMNVYGPGAEKAKRVAGSGQTTRVLYDPNRSDRLLYIDALVHP